MNQSEKDFYRDCGYDIPENNGVKISINTEPDKARGKRGTLISYEEAGSFNTQDVVKEEAGLMNYINSDENVIHLKSRRAGQTFTGNQIYSYLKDLWRNEPTTDRTFKLYTDSKGATMFDKAVKEVTEEDYKQVTEPFK